MKKRIISILFIISLLATMSCFTLTTFAEDITLSADIDWYDSTQTEFTIYTAEELLGVALLAESKNINYEGKTIKLGDNIVFNTGDATTWGITAPVNSFPGIGKVNGIDFKGKFDGQGFSISGLYICSTGSDVGFINATTGAEIKNLSIVNSYIQGASRVGGIVGRINGNNGDISNTISNVYVDATIVSTVAQAGGIVGSILHWAGNTVLEECSFAGSITAPKTVGGIIGDDSAAGFENATAGPISCSITNCANYGEVNCQTQLAGGIAGYIYYSKVENCINTGNINLMSGATTTIQYFGGIVGKISKITEIDGCYSKTEAITDTTITLSGVIAGAIDGETATITNSFDVADSNMKGSNSAAFLSELDFTNTYQTVVDSYPMLAGTVLLLEQSTKDPVYIPETQPETEPETEPVTETVTESITDSVTELIPVTTTDEGTTSGCSGCTSSVGLGGIVILSVISFIGTCIIRKKS